MKILILYASFGGGHAKAAEALKEYYTNFHPDYKIEYIDALKYSSPELNKLLLHSYIQLSKNAPKAWGRLYHLADNHKSITDISSIASKVASKKFKDFTINFNPDIILCTHPFSMDMLASLKRKNIINAKIGLVLTDYASHSIWETQSQYVDAFFVAHPGMVEQLTACDISENKIFVTGIPTLQTFHEEHNREIVLKDLDLDSDKFTLLFFPGGEYGLSKNMAIFKDILRIPNIQIIAGCGKNAKMKLKLEKLAKVSTKKIRILGYTDKMPDLLSACNIVVSKPGGLTTSECIVTHTPIVINSPLPGQEDHNSNYVLNNGLGFRLFEGTNKYLTLKAIINNKKRQEQVIEMQKELAKPFAAQNICEKMIELTNKK